MLRSLGANATLITLVGIAYPTSNKSLVLVVSPRKKMKLVSLEVLVADGFSSLLTLDRRPQGATPPPTFAQSAPQWRHAPPWSDAAHRARDTPPT